MTEQEAFAKAQKLDFRHAMAVLISARNAPIPMGYGLPIFQAVLAKCHENDADYQQQFHALRRFVEDKGLVKLHESLVTQIVRDKQNGISEYLEIACSLLDTSNDDVTKEQ